MPSAEYSVILFRNVRTDIPSVRAAAVRFPWVLTSGSSTRSRSTSLTGDPTSHRARRRREALDIGEWGYCRSMATLQARTTPSPTTEDRNMVNEFLTAAGGAAWNPRSAPIFVPMGAAPSLSKPGRAVHRARHSPAPARGRDGLQNRRAGSDTPPARLP